MEPLAAIQNTARDLLQLLSAFPASDLGYTCVVVHDACATRDQEFEGTVVPAGQVHAAFMAALKFGYAKTVSAEEYFAGKADEGRGSARA